jgi:hypothetical protein
MKTWPPFVCQINQEGLKQKLHFVRICAKYLAKRIERHNGLFLANWQKKELSTTFRGYARTREINREIACLKKIVFAKIVDFLQKPSCLL